MGFDWKRALRNLGLLLGMSFLGLLVLLPVILLGAFGAFPPYVTYGGIALGVSAVIALFLRGCDYFPERWSRWLGRGMLCVLAAAAIYMGSGFYRDQLPTVDDRALLLWEYEPFAVDTKAVHLEEDAALQFQRDQRLRLDGATALYPVYAAFVQAVYPEERYPQYDSLVECSGTIDAYQHLLSGKTDMIFAAGPSQAQLDMAAKAGMELHLTPIGKEAFVFFVNSKNPVTGLTVEQIQGIYTGSITNWHQVGGKRWPIRPFQRAENSGSQTALQRLMEGLPLLEPEEEERVSAMSGIIREVASYRNYKNAIGFSFRFYAAEMASSDQIRLLALNGVPPTQETIRDGSYPISSDFYAVTAAPVGAPIPQETNESMAAFLDWILSDQGQTIVEETGYVRLQ